MGFSPSMFMKQVDVLFKHLPYSNVASITGVTLVSLILWKIQPSDILLMWYLASLSLFVCRFVAHRNFSTRQTSVQDAPFWYLLFVIGTFVSGLLWGALPVLYHSETVLSYQQSLMANSIAVIFIIALVSGAIIIHAMNKLVMLCFTIPAIFPASLFLLSLDVQYFSLLGVLLLVFFAFLYALQVRFDQRINEIFWREELDVLTQNYDADDTTVRDQH